MLAASYVQDNVQEAKQAVKLIEKWEAIDVADALELSHQILRS